MSCILPIQVSSIGFSSAGSQQHKMNLVWTLLLLAAATGSVYSHAGTSYQAYEDYFKSLCELKCNNLIPSLEFPPIPYGLVNVITGFKIVTVSFQNPKIIKENDAYCLEVVIYLDSTCNQFTAFKIKLFVRIGIVFGIENGCPHYSVNENFAVFKLSVEGLGIQTVISEAIVKTIQPLLQENMYLSFGEFINSCNDVSSSFTKIFYVGLTPCYFSYHSVTQYQDFASYTCGLFLNGLEVVDENYNEYARLEAGESSFYIVGAKAMSKLVELRTTGCQTEYPLSYTDCLSLGLEGYGEAGLFLQLIYGEVPQCAISSNGIKISGTLFINIQYGGKVIVKARASIYTDAELITNDGYHSFGLFIGAGISLGTDLEVISVPTGCGCSDKISQHIQSIVYSCLGGFKAQLNARLNLRIPFNSFPGKSGSRRSCSYKPNCIKCVQYYGY